MFSNPSAAILRGAAAAIMYWGFEALKTTPSHSYIQTQEGGHFQFLTVIVLVFAGITMIFGLAADLLPFISIFEKGKRTLSMMAMPAAIIVFLIYWPLLIFAPSWILMRDPNVAVPTPENPGLFRSSLIVDLALHATPSFALALDFFLFEKRYPRKEALYGGPAVLIAFGVFYSTLVEYFASFNGHFPYPFLDVPVETRVLIYFVVVAAALVIFWILNAVHR